MHQIIIHDSHTSLLEFIKKYLTCVIALTLQSRPVRDSVRNFTEQETGHVGRPSASDKQGQWWCLTRRGALPSWWCEAGQRGSGCQWLGHKFPHAGSQWYMITGSNLRLFFFFLIAIISYTHNKRICEATGHYESALVGSWPADKYIT